MLRALSGPGQSARRVGVAVLLLMPLASSLLPVLAQRRAPDPDGIAGARPVFTSLVGTVTAIGQSGPTDAGRRTGAYLRLDTGAKTLTLWMGPHVPENLWDNITEGDRIAARAVRNRSRNDYGAVCVSVGDSTYSLHNFVPNGPCASNRRSGSLGRPPPCDSMLGGRVGPHRGLGRSRSGHHRSAPPLVRPSLVRPLLRPSRASPSRVFRSLQAPSPSLSRARRSLQAARAASATQRSPKPERRPRRERSSG